MRFRLVSHHYPNGPLVRVNTESRTRGFACALVYFRRTFPWLMRAGWRVYLEDEEGRLLAHTPPGRYRLTNAERARTA